ncbi:MAG TPA: hypothetical protein VMH00_01590 [Candidatus Limnocylindrales bacterium]|nr:hypothetical protein [Candidatus Limnocylindrales bacterium]
MFPKLRATALVVCAFFILILSVPALGQSDDAAKETANPFRELHFRPLGPVGNRTAAVVGEPGNPLVIYAGAAAGGIFKTEDGGVNWHPVFDNEDVAAVGALAVSPVEHNVVWAGTGEPWLIRPFYPMGDGVYRSTDAGKSWQHVGLEETGHIARIVADPENPEGAYVCAIGQAYRPQHERGVFRTTDGGKTWQQVLFVDENTGCSELSMDAHDPQTLFAGMWQVDIKTWDLNSGGKSSGVYVTHDGGKTWKKLSGHGLPDADHPLGKVAVQVAPSDSNRVYALVQDTTPGLYRSNDGGKTWTLVNQSHLPSERSPYYTRFGIAPDNPDLLYFPSVTWSVSKNGGETLADDITRAGGDNHDVWIDPLNPNRILDANDQGINISLNRGKTYEHVILPIAQVYHVYTDTRIPYNVFGNRQDGSSYYGPSNNLELGFFGGQIGAGDWKAYGGCESGFGIPDPKDPDIVWSGCYNGGLDRTNLKTGQARNVEVWPDPDYGWAPADVKYRWHWTFPIAISPFDHNKVYVGSQYVHMTTDAGQSWTIISPDLTTNDKSHQQNSGGVSYDNLMTFDGSTLYAIAESPKQEGVIWTGSNDGQVNVTKDGGKNWTNVTKHVSGLPPWGTVMNVEPSPFDAGTAYVAVDLEQVGDYNTYVYKTADFGATWKLISGAVPKSVNSSAKCIMEDPVRKGMLYLGTNNALYVSWDDGEHWLHLRNNLPPAPVYWIEVEPRFNDLLIATHGRGIYDLDDITPLRNWDKAQSSEVYLFPPRASYRFRTIQTTRGRESERVEGENPPYGADINFYLQKPADKWNITITDAENKVIRKLDGKGEAGLNRVWWNLSYDPPMPVHLLTPPPDAPWVQPGAPAGFGPPNPEPKKEGWRPLVIWGVGEAGAGLRVPPGRYTVKLTVGDKSSTEPVEILHDPGSVGTTADIDAQVKLLLEIRGELADLGEMINHLERTRRQLEDLSHVLAGPKAMDAREAAKQFEDKVVAVEGLLFDVHLTGQIEDSFRHSMMLYGKLANLDSELGGDGADLPPTDQQIAVNKELAAQIDQAREKVKEVTGKETAAFNQQLKSLGFAASIEP